MAERFDSIANFIVRKMRFGSLRARVGLTARYHEPVYNMKHVERALVDSGLGHHYGKLHRYLGTDGKLLSGDQDAKVTNSYRIWVKQSDISQALEHFSIPIDIGQLEEKMDEIDRNEMPTP